MGFEECDKFAPKSKTPFRESPYLSTYMVPICHDYQLPQILNQNHAPIDKCISPIEGAREIEARFFS